MLTRDDINKINENIADLEEIEEKIRCAQHSEGLGITLSGSYQKPAFVDVIRPVVVKELMGIREDIVNDLHALGVEIPMWKI
jgi:hypothetical protein